MNFLISYLVYASSQLDLQVDPDLNFGTDFDCISFVVKVFFCYYIPTWICFLYLFIMHTFTRFPDDKLYNMNTDQECLLVLRHITSQKLKDVHYRENRAHLLSEHVEFESEEPSVSIYEDLVFLCCLYNVLNLYILPKTA